MEVEKVNAEIASSLDSAADALLQKFVLIGAILVALSGLKKADARQVFERFSTRPGLSVALSVAAIVSLLIDAKLRANIVTIDLKAQWLLYIEERFGRQILLYEHYLRRPGNLHTDEVFRYVHWMQLSAATGILYVGYLASLTGPVDSKSQRHQVHALVFYTCQAALVIFAFAAHYLPADLHVLPYWPMTESVLHSSPLATSMYTVAGAPRMADRRSKTSRMPSMIARANASTCERRKTRRRVACCGLSW